MLPLFADADPTDDGPVWLLAPIAVVTFASNLLLIALSTRGHWRWVGAVRRRLGRRGLVGLMGMFLTFVSGGGLLAASFPTKDAVWKLVVIWIGGPVMLAAGLFLLAAAVRNRPRQVNKLSRTLFDHLPDVPIISDPPRDPVVPPAERAFLLAIRASPSDDTPRLIYADWLDDRSDPRAEYLRAEVDANRGDPDAERRADELCFSFDPAWVHAVRRE